MIIYSLWLYEVDACYLADFVTAFRESGVLYESLRHIPGHLHTDLLGGMGNPSGRCRLLSISFFTSFEALLRAESSAQMRAHAHWLRERTMHCIPLGTFSHFTRPEAGIPSARTLDQLHTEFTPMDVHR